jgi:hypothetical protein
MAVLALAVGVCACSGVVARGTAPGGDGGTSSSRDSGVRDGGEAATRDGTVTAAPDCTALAACCAEFPDPQEVYGCLITGGSATLCNASLTALEAIGYCTGAPDAATGEPGGAASPGEPGGPDCDYLTECCAKLSSMMSGPCGHVASTGTDNQCLLATNSLLSAGYCGLGDGGPACTALAQCCPSLSAGRETSCRIVAYDGIESICQTDLPGFCAGSGTGTGSGSSSSGQNEYCKELAQCCPLQTGQNVAACEQIVATNVGGRCSAWLTALGVDAGCGG